MRYMCDGLIHFSAMDADMMSSSSSKKRKRKLASNSTLDDADIISQLSPVRAKGKTPGLPTVGTRDMESDDTYNSAKKFLGRGRNQSGYKLGYGENEA